MSEGGVESRRDYIVCQTVGSICIMESVDLMCCMTSLNSAMGFMLAKVLSTNHHKLMLK